MIYRAQDSPAVTFLRLVWESQGHQRGHSYDRINHAMREALAFVIKYGFEFAREDFALLAQHPSNAGFNFGYWCGNDGHMTGESFYRLAVQSKHRYGANPSAALAFEHWKGRTPFLIRRDPKLKTPSRVAVGTSFEWYGERLTCTSFSETGDHLTACSYTTTEGKDCPECGVRREDRQGGVDERAIR
jgi:hypothetical protein